MRRMLGFLVVAVLSLAVAPVRGTDAPSLLGILEIRGLDNLSAAAFELSKATGAPTPKEAISLMLHGALGTMPGMGIEPEGKVRAVWLYNGSAQGGAVLQLPVVNNGDDYLASLGQTGWKSEPAEDQDIQRFIPPAGSGMAWTEVFFLKAGGTLLAAANPGDLRKAAEALPELPPILPVEGDLAIQIHPAVLMTRFGSEIQAQVDTAFQSASEAGAAEAEKIGRLYLDGYMALARQLDTFTAGLGVADGLLNIHTRVAPVAGTTLAQWLDSMQTPSAKAAAVNLPGALFIQTAHLGDLNLLAPAYFRYMEALMALVPPAAEGDFMKAYMEQMKAAWAQIGGDFGIALMTPTREAPLRAAEYLALKDAGALRDLTRQMIDNENKMMQTMAGDTNMPVPFRFDLQPGEPREHRGIPVDTLVYTLTPGESLAAAWPQGLPDKLHVETAWLPDGVIITVGDPTLTDAVVDRVLDGVSAPVADLPAWQAFYPNPDAGANAHTHLALFDLLRSVLGVVDAYTGGDTAKNIPAGPGNLEALTYPAMGGVMSRLRFSLADIGAVGQRIREAREKAMAEMMAEIERMEDLSEDADILPEEASEAELNAGEDAPETISATGASEESVPEDAPVGAEEPAPAVSE